MNQCQPARGGEIAVLFVGLYLVAFGTSGVKAACPSLGADQFDENDPKEAAKLSSYFNWFLFSLTIGGMLGVTFLVWISENQGWDWSFAVCSIAIGMAILFLTMGKSLYRNNVPKGSPILRILQVFVAAFRNRNLPLPENESELHQIPDKDAVEILKRTDQLKYVCLQLNTSFNYKTTKQFG